MQIINKDTDTFEVMGDTGKAYTVTFTSCTCPHFKLRIKNTGGKCKHMIFVLNELTKKDEVNLKLFQYITNEAEVSFVDLQSKFGDVTDRLSIMEKQGGILYNRKRDTYTILE